MACQEVFHVGPGDVVIQVTSPDAACTLQGVVVETDCDGQPIRETEYSHFELADGIRVEAGFWRRYELRVLRSPANCKLMVRHIFESGETFDNECEGGDEITGPWTLTTCQVGG